MHVKDRANKHPGEQQPSVVWEDLILHIRSTPVPVDYFDSWYQREKEEFPPQEAVDAVVVRIAEMIGNTVRSVLDGDPHSGSLRFENAIVADQSTIYCLNHVLERYPVGPEAKVHLNEILTLLKTVIENGGTFHYPDPPGYSDMTYEYEKVLVYLSHEGNQGGSAPKVE